MQPIKHYHQKELVIYRKGGGTTSNQSPRLIKKSHRVQNKS